MPKKPPRMSFSLMILILLLLTTSILATRGETPTSLPPGVVDYASQAVLEAQRAQLARLREQPHSADKVSKQFAHDINSHLPDGVAAKLDPTEYWKDDVTGLVHHRLSHVSDQDFQKLVKVTRRNANSVMAYNMQQITGY